MVPRRFAVLVLAALFGASPAFAQISAGGEGVSQYEMRFGEPVSVSIEDLVQNPSAYEGRAVRTHGKLELDPTGSFHTYVIRGTFGDRLRVQPVPELSGSWDGEVLTIIGNNLDVTGVFATSSAQTQAENQGIGSITFWKYFGDRPEIKDVTKIPVVSLEQLSTGPEHFDGRQVRIVGQFRGRNLYGDLPVSSQLDRADWVVKDDVYSVWVSGRRPKGDGFDLDATLKRDTGKWLEVVGHVDVRKGFPYVVAQRVSLTTAPTPVAQAKPPAPPVERPRVPPMVIFALPLDGESDVSGSVRFAVQFSKDMDEDSFRGHVVLRYAGRVMPGDRDLDGVMMHYDGGRRALIVDPGDILRPGRQIELLLLPGILDIDGLPLVPRSGLLQEGAQVVDVLHWRIGL